METRCAGRPASKSDPKARLPAWRGCPVQVRMKPKPHDFHQGWTIALRNALNAGLLPPGYFAMAEQITGGPAPDVVTLDVAPRPELGAPTGAAVQNSPPQVRTELDRYARTANRIIIHYPDGDVVAVIEIVSPGNKSSRHAVHSFARKAVDFLAEGIHLLVVDLFPPGRRDPQGIHKVIWDRLEDEPFTLPAGKPLTAVSYAAGDEIVAYIEPVAAGDPLPDMPVFLTPDRHILAPLESTYRVKMTMSPRLFGEEFRAVLLHDVLTGRMANDSDVLGAKGHLAARAERQAFGAPGVVVQDAEIAATHPGLDDDPHAIHAAVDDAPAFLRGDVKQQLSRVPRRQRDARLARRDRECVRVSGVPLLGGHKRPAIGVNRGALHWRFLHRLVSPASAKPAPPRKPAPGR